MIGWLIRRFRWVILGWLARTLTRLGLKNKLDRSIDTAAADLENRLPAPVVKAAEKLPGDLVRSGGAAIVATQRSRDAANQARRIASGTKRSTDRVVTARRHLFDTAQSVVSEVRDESETARRRIKSDVLRETEGEAAALDALLDLRESDDDKPLPDVPPAVRSGRRRFRPALPAAPVNRVQRTYRKPTKPWDR